MGYVSSGDPMEQACQVLHDYFGYKDFHNGQGEVIHNILQSGNTIAIFPTGGGKSLCYQIPAMLLPGTTIVISPLISLMKDQVDSLVKRNISASYISSALSDHEVFQRIKEMEQGKFKIVYIAPERFNSESFISALKSIRIPFVAIDEAHCISQWGHNFRPAYLKIKDFIDYIGNPIIAAFTATANKKVQQDIVDLLGLAQCKLFISSFDRANLEFCVESPRDNNDFILNYIRKHPENAGIIYAATRRNVEDLYYYLKNHGAAVGMYHAGLPSEQRSKYQDSFINGSIPIMVATNAFGMGINKSNVRYIIHYNMPKSVESYYQEAGRAGRDGEKAVCILLKNTNDYKLNKFMINGNYPPINVAKGLYTRIKKRDKLGFPVELLLNKNVTGYSMRQSALKKIVEYNYVDIRGGIAYATERNPFQLTQEDIDLHKDIEIEKLDSMERYFEEQVCLRSYILRYFNEKPAQEHCGNCSLCFRNLEQDNNTLINRLLSHIFGK